ncbi:MAG: class A beta-lactamase-related serine hydrolase [Chitinophagaceae bacterium]|nr:MAG: class A beta-lactamase-related serine hydrolase [Chitinophagaceae bacterium]
MKNALKCIPLMVILAACGQNKDKSRISESTPTGVAIATHTSSLSTEEFRRYSNASKEFAEKLFGNGRLNGSLLVAKNGEIIYEMYSGFRNPKSHKDSITPTTPFHLASVSKTITAMAVLKLADEGKIRVSDPLSVYLPQFPLPGVTVKSLLNHRSGLPNYVHYMERLGWDKKRTITNQDVFDFIVTRHKDIDIGAADRRFSYSNTNYALLALLIEKVSGQSYGQYLHTSLFEPLGMKDTYAYTLSDSARSLPSYFHNGRQYAFDFLDLVYGDKNIYSTARDMLKFDQALNSGKFVNKLLLDSAYTPYSFEKPGTHNYGLGWRMLLLKNGKKVIYHNGWWHGNRTAFYRLLDENVAIIAFCNNDSKMIYKTKDMADIFGNYFHDESEKNDAITLR